MPYWISAILSPFVGAFVNQYGKRMTVSLVGSVTVVVAHVLLFVIPICEESDPANCSSILPLVPLVLLGFSYSTYSVVLWGSFPYMVDERTLGTAFGICTAFQNFGSAVASPLIGYLTIDPPNSRQNKQFYRVGYEYVELFFICISILGLIFNILAHNSVIK